MSCSPLCCLYDLGAILLGVANHELGRSEEGIRRDGEQGPVGNIVGILNGL